GNAAIVPGFVNAHTHLELGPVEGDRKSQAEAGELAWLKKVIEQRRTDTKSIIRQRVEENVKAAIAAGTTFLADTTTAGVSWKPVAAAPLRAVVFAEVLGLRRDRGLETDAAAWKWLGSIRPENQVAGCARVGLSPHAPYSTSGWLYYKAAASGLPLST